MEAEFDKEGFEELVALFPSELALVEHTVVKWQCCVKDCEGGSRIKDYGASPFFYWRKKWIDLSNQVLYCSKHWKQFKNTGFPPESNVIFKDGPGLNHLVFPEIQK